MHTEQSSCFRTHEECRESLQMPPIEVTLYHETLMKQGRLVTSSNVRHLQRIAAFRAQDHIFNLHLSALRIPQSLCLVSVFSNASHFGHTRGRHAVHFDLRRSHSCRLVQRDCLVSKLATEHCAREELRSAHCCNSMEYLQYILACNFLHLDSHTGGNFARVMEGHLV